MGKYMNYEVSSSPFWKVSDFADSLEEDTAEMIQRDKLHKNHIRRWKKFLRHS